MMDFVFGWDATCDNINDWMYDYITNNFVLNKETCSWIQKVNPWALYTIAERLLEAVQRGMWNANETTLQKLKDAFIEAEGSIEEGL